MSKKGISKREETAIKEKMASKPLLVEEAWGTCKN